MDLSARNVSPALAAAFCACAGLIALTHRSAEARKPASAEDQLDLPALPAKVLGPLSFGMKPLVADAFFLDGIQLNGGRGAKLPEAEQERYDRAMARALALALDLDPKFEVAYRFAANALQRVTPDGKVYNVRATIPLLEQGVRECPGDWRIPFLLGFYQSFYLGQMADAAANMGIAAHRPGAPAYLGLLATRMAADANDLDTAERMANTMLEQADTDEERAQWQARIVDLHMQRHLNAIEAAAKKFRDRTGAVPHTVDELVASGDLPAVPKEPHGGRYGIDPATGLAGSTKAERLRVFGKQQGKPGSQSQGTSGLEVQ